MAEILKEWLTERLQKPITWNAEGFGRMMRNGHVVASVLLSYHVITEEKYFLIRFSDGIEDIKSNWKYLKEWLRELEINMTDTDLDGVMEGKGTVLLRLFYQLFLHLDKKDRIDFIKRERKHVSSLVTKMGQRFRVEKIDEEEEPAIAPLSRPLLNEQHFIEWQRKKEEQVKDTYDYIRHKYSKIVQKIEEKNTPLQYKAPKSKKMPDKDKMDMEKFSKRFPCKSKNYTYEELLNLDANVAERKRSLVGSEWAQNYMDNLCNKNNKKSDSEEFQKQMRNVLSGSMWDMSVNEEETKLDSDLAKKVMKLSQFEKQMCTQIMETKQQARNLFKNRVHAQKEFAEQREQQFNQYLDNIKEQIQLEVVEIDFEKQRQIMLHKKLYAEKIKRKRQHYYEICYETMLSIVDYATRYAYFKRLIGEDIPEHYIHEWKSLYFKKQPIFEILTPTEDLLKEPGFEEEICPEEEEIIRLELERQEAMNDSEFLEYHTYTGPWALEGLIPNYDPDSEERKFEYIGMRVLGHVVYTLLEIKYPYPPPRPPADLPDFSAKALLRNLPDKSITYAMQILLNLKKILVVRLEAAINFCLKQFKLELVGCTDIELSFDKFIAAAQEEPDKDLIRLIKAEDESTSKSSEATAPATGPLAANTKQTQTPKAIPEEEIKLSAAAELGKYAYEILSIGDSLSDYLLAAMIVEYIKDQDGVKGFVIVNYPNCYREAQILEETFSGRQPPNEENLDDRDEIYLEESISKHRKKEKDPHKEIRMSKLVIDPHKKRIQKPFESYFTCYIQLKETEDILQELVIWELNEENSELIDRFYAALGLNYSMYYEVIEKEFLAQICKYIIGDYLMPLKSSDTLFGENVLSALDFPTSDDKRTKTKIVKSDVSNAKSRERLGQTSKMSKLSINNNLETVKPASSTDMMADDTLIECDPAVEEEQKSLGSYEEAKVLAGEEDWDYAEIPIVDFIGVALATCWEQLEKTYINDMKQLLFVIRLQLNCLVPYARFIKDKMEQIITLPSHKQDLVSKFQSDYNDFENDWRDVNGTKNEWHCRVKELQNKLYHICDERKLHAESQRQSLIMENWAMEELTSMVNTYISCMQAEQNRSTLTFQALHDFYYAQLKRLPPNERLSCKDLTKIYRDTDETSGSKKGGEDKVFRQLRSAFLELQLKDIQIDFSNNPFNLIIETNVKFALKLIKETNDSYRSLISREYTEYAKLAPAAKNKQDNTSVESVCSEEIFKQNALKCIDEWTMAINGEMFRASLRILALQYKCYRDMKLFNDYISRTFMEVQNDINTYYLNEIKSVDRLCKYIQLAVENGRKITESLILEHDSFVIDPNLLQFPPPAPPSGVLKVDDYVTDMEFKVSQLARLRTQFKIVAPTGIALQQAFIYLLQDFIFFGKETCEGSLVPEAWKRVNPELVSKLVFLLFGETAYVDWRDFLIYCLNIRFPKVDELLQVRHNFRCVDPNSTELISRDDFMKEELWFEQDFDSEDQCVQLRKNLIKHFLFELYETSENLMNYSAFLLAFCKNTDPIEGFTSALSLAVGKKTCSSVDECQEVVCEMIKQKQYRDDCLACALKCTQQFLDKVINSVVDTCEGTTVIEMQYIPPVEEKKGGKDGGKGKGKEKPSPKSKKAGESEAASQSARLVKQKSLTLASRSKTTQSADDVKTTFICQPCAADEMEQKPEEKEIVEEEHKPESPRENPDLAYAVSQQVIWNVLRICLPWHFKLLPEERVTPYVQQVEEAMKRLEMETDNGDIYVCHFVTDPNVCKLLHKVKKFTALNLAEQVSSKNKPIAAQEEPDKDLIRLIKAEDESTSKSSEATAPATGPLAANTKQTQTPKAIPEEEIKLSAAAELGKYAYEILSIGDSLSDYLLAAMIVEYIKDQDGVKGFVIVNYPNCYREAQILEETFSGRQPPNEENLDDRDEIYLEESISKHRKKEKDPHKEIRMSKLVIDPHKKRIQKPFESYFTCYIQLKETEDILQELVIWELNEENSELIDRFYAALGLNYSMYYEVIEKEFLAQICKYIIGDYLMPLKSSDTLFGENVLSALDFPTSDDKRTKTKIVKSDVSNAKSRERLGQTSKMSKLSINNNLETVKPASSTDMMADDTLIECDPAVEEEQKSLGSYEEAKVLAGEEDWDYAEIPIVDFIGVALATCWEQLEKTYINDMKQLLFVIRLQLNCLVPYARFIKDKMEQIITLPSHKQDLVSKFQSDYNDFENDWRDVNGTKNEWHCRVKELQNKLYHICDERKLHAESQRQSLIMENWAMEELTSMVNTYISCMQAEQNRSTLTFQALHDFYYAQLKRLPPNERLSCKDLTKIYRDTDETSGSKKGGEDKVFRQLRSAFLELQLKDIQIDFSNNPFNLIIETNVKFALKLIKETNDSYRSLISREYTEYAKLAPAAKNKQDNTSVESVCSEEIFKQNALKCIDEWTMAINGEMFRASLRILALQYKCYRDMKLFNDYISRTFMEVQNDINTYYLNEIKSVDRLCKYIQLAVENGRKITESLILEHDSFVIDPNLLQFPPPAPPSGVLKVDDYVTDMEFKVSQLARLRTQFKIVAPTGIALQQAFIYLLQDFIFFGKETCEGSLVPEAWKRVNPELVSKLVFLLFGETAYVDWRDFLIYCLNIRFPKVDELLQVRHNFRCVDPNSTELISRDDFMKEELWFEQDFDSEDQCVQLRKNLIKHFLFELYETSENLMNYSAFLLAFCKNTDPIEGFTSALSLAVGKKTCSSVDECQEVVCEMIKQKQYRDDCLACALKCTQQFLDKVINSVVDTCEGTTVIEMQYIPPVEEKKGGKDGGKGKGKEKPSPKSKKAGESEAASQSARLVKQKSLTLASRSKTTQSADDVKTTFICQPCAADEMEQKPEEKEIVEEEHKPESPRENPDLAYAVSQQVIWNVLRICLPWHFKLLPEERVTPYVQQVEEAMKRLEMETDNGDIYVCHFVTDPNVCKLLHKVKKFTALNLAEEVHKIIP